MHVGICIVRLRLPENDSLKSKRQVVRSLTGRVRSRFPVAIAEVDDLDSWQAAALGIVCVSNSAQHANSILSNVIAFIEGNALDVELVDYKLELQAIF